METLIYAGQGRGCQRITSPSICSVVKRRALQFFLFAEIALFLPAAHLRAELSSGATYSLSFVDMDGNKVSTADGRVTILVLVYVADREKQCEVVVSVSDLYLVN